MTNNTNTIGSTIAIQGVEGSFHHAAAQRYWEDNIVVDCHDTFEGVVDAVSKGSVDYGLMAIENSIAGTLLQNYRLLRDEAVHVVGEVYLQIKHQLMVLPDADLHDIKSVQSHPMAINQCLEFLNGYNRWTRIHASDTAGSAQEIKMQNDTSVACIASSLAAEIYGLKIVAQDIQTHPVNYTRFLVLSREGNNSAGHNKASIYLSIPDQRGILSSILTAIDEAHINLSKLQSYPVMGKLRSYYFHLDLEYEDPAHLDTVLPNLFRLAADVRVLGTYHRTDHLIVL